MRRSRRMGRRTIAVGIIALTGVASSVASAASMPTVRCDSIITPVGPFTWRPELVVLDVAAVPPAFIPQTVPSGDEQWPYWSKAALIIRAHSQVLMVSVPRRWRNRVTIGWGNVDTASTLRFASCPPSSSLGRWNPYSGGFQLRSRAACVPLTFRVGDRSTTVRFGVGKRCG